MLHSDQSKSTLSSHFVSRLQARFSTPTSPPLLCPRKMCTAQSSPLLFKLTVLPDHVRNCPRPVYTHLCRQSFPRAMENDEEQGQRAAHFLVTELLQCLPTETLCEVTHRFEEAVQKEMWSPRSLGNSSPCVSQEPGCLVRESATWLPCNRIAECVL